VAVAVVGGAGEGLAPAVTSDEGVDDKVGAAAAIDPDAATVMTPGSSLDAGCAADLAAQLDPAPQSAAAVVALAVVGGTGDDLPLTLPLALPLTLPIALSVAADHELGAAAAVHPDALRIVAPGLALNAGGAADLARQLHAAAGVGVAVMAIAIVRGAGEGLSLSLTLSVAVSASGELSAAAAVHPDALHVVAPGLALNAGGAADLARQLHAAARVEVAVVAAAVVGRAGDGLALLAVSVVVLRRCGKSCGAEKKCCGKQQNIS